MQNKIKQFNKAFMLPTCKDANQNINERKQLFKRLISEEVDECWEGCNIHYHGDENKGYTDVFDALIDMTYLTLGAYEYHNLTCTYSHNYVNESKFNIDFKSIRVILDMIEEELENYIISDNIEVCLDFILSKIFYLVAKCGFLNVFAKGFNEVHASNMSKLCNTMVEVFESVETYQNKGIKATYKQVDNHFVLYRNDGKVLKGINYFEPKLKEILFN